MNIFFVHIAHRDARDGCGARFIHFVNKVVKSAVIFDKVGIFCAVHSDLVGKPPHAYRRVIVILHYKLPHLEHSVFVAAAHVARNIRNLRPDDHTALVAKIVKIPVVLIVCKSDGVCADLTDEVHILQMMLGKERIADLPAVLMAADTTERIFFTVQNKSVFGIYAEGAATKSRRKLIYLLLSAYNCCLCRIKIRIDSSVPEMNVVYLQQGSCLRALRFSHNASGTVKDTV